MSPVPEQEIAADFLNISISSLVNLLESGKLPSLQMNEVSEYKKRRDEERRQGLAEILHRIEDEGLYY